MIFFIIFVVFGYIAAELVLQSVAAMLVNLVFGLLAALQRRGVGEWLFAPFRAWTGLDETRRPKP